MSRGFWFTGTAGTTTQPPVILATPSPRTTSPVPQTTSPVPVPQTTSPVPLPKTTSPRPLTTKKYFFITPKVVPRTTKMSCANPQGISNGEIVGSTNYTDGSRVYYSCNTGFAMTGSPSQLCSSGTWVGTAPSCAQITTQANITLAGLDMPVWLFITLIVFLVLLLFCIFLLIFLYICCRYCGDRCCDGCCRRNPVRNSQNRVVEDRTSVRYEDHHFIGHTSPRRNQHNGNTQWIGQRSSIQNRNKPVSQSLEKPGGARVIRVAPGEQFVLVTEDTNYRGSSSQSSEDKQNKDYAQFVNNNATMKSNEVVLGPYTVPGGIPPEEYRFKAKANQVKLANKWMPHSQPIRSDAAHTNTITK